LIILNNVFSFFFIKIVLQGVAGISFQGDIALDDLQIVDGNCPSDLPLECDFDDESICGFVNDDTEKHQWIRHKGTYTKKEKKRKVLFDFLGATPGIQNGPSVDHSTMSSSGKIQFDNFPIFYLF
jgi:hypothetical protein